MILGVGSLEPNERDYEQDEDPPATKDKTWKKLLDGEDPLTLKSWADVSILQPNRANLGLALREYMRQAWGDVFLVCLFFLSNSICLENSGRRGKITWGKLAKDPQSLVPSRFLLTPQLDNPTRLPVETITKYWTNWALKEKRDDPFSFFNADGSGGGNDQGGDWREDFDFTIDNGLLSPVMCGPTSSERAHCLQALVTASSGEAEVFRTTIQLVDTLEVSCIEYKVLTISYRFSG